MLLCLGDARRSQRAIVWIQRSGAQTYGLLGEPEVVLGSCYLELRGFQVLRRNAPSLIQRTTSFVSSAGVSNSCPSIAQCFLVLGVGLGDVPGDYAAFVCLRFS